MEHERLNASPRTQDVPFTQEGARWWHEMQEASTLEALRDVLGRQLDLWKSTTRACACKTLAQDCAALRDTTLHTATLHREGNPQATFETWWCARNWYADHPLFEVWLKCAKTAWSLVQHHEANEHLSKRLQALYAISAASGRGEDLHGLLARLHKIVATLMYAENFFIVGYNPSDETLEFLIFEDSVEPGSVPVGTQMPMSELERGCTWYVLKDKRTLIGTTQELAQQVSGPLQLHGVDGYDWLGVPIVDHEKVLGAIVVQSYVPEQRFSSEDRAFLEFVAQHIWMVIAQRQSSEELERQVQQRTQDLEASHQQLEREMLLRIEEEHIQASLALIAADTYIEERWTHAWTHLRTWMPLFAWRITWTPPGKEGERLLHTFWPLEMDGQAGGEVSDDTSTLAWHVTTGHDRQGSVHLYISPADPNLWWEKHHARLTYVFEWLGTLWRSMLLHEAATHALEESHKHLEQRVLERTSALQSEVEARQKAEAQLRHEVLHDALTGLPNRAFLLDRLQRTFARWRRDPRQVFALLYLDVDKFKHINDTLGHTAGDAVLCTFAQRVLACVRAPDTVARLGGDEFAVLLDDVAHPEDALRVARRIVEAIQMPIEVAGGTWHTSTSVGIAVIDTYVSTAEDLLRSSDEAMYRAKHQGAGRCVVFNSDLHAEAVQQLELERVLTHENQPERFSTFQEPMCDARERTTVLGMKCTLGWSPPGSTLPLATSESWYQAAQRLDILGPIEIAWIEYHIKKLMLMPETQDVWLHLSTAFLRQVQAAERLTDLTQRAGVDPGRVRLAFSLDALTVLRPPQQTTLHALSLQGFPLHARDFGAGPLPLTMLQTLGIRSVGLASSLLEAAQPLLDKDRPSGQSLETLRALASLGNALGLDVTASGIHDETLLQSLLEAGIWRITGPLSPHEARWVPWQKM